MVRLPGRTGLAGCLTLALGLTVLGASGVHAEPAPPLNLGPAITQALQAHPQIQQAESGVRAAGHTTDAARWGWWPSAQVQASTGQHYRESAFIVDQTLWNWGRTQAGVDAAEARGQVATLGVAQSAQDLAERTAESYLLWTAAKERLTHFDTYTGELVRLGGVIERRAKEGVAAPADVEQARVRIEQARAAQVAVRSAEGSARLALESLMMARLQDTPSSWPDLPPMNADEAWRECEARHPTLASTRAERVALGHEADERSSQLLPRLGLRYQEPIQRNPGTTYPPRWQLMLQAQTDGAAVARSQGRADQEKLLAAVQREQALRLQLQAQVQQAALETRMGLQQREAAEHAAQQTAALVASATRQFEAGRRTWLDLLNAVREAHEARLNALAARHSQNLAAARLHALAQTLPGLAEFNQRVSARASESAPAAPAAAPLPAAAPSAAAPQ